MITTDGECFRNPNRQKFELALRTKKVPDQVKGTNENHNLCVQTIAFALILILFKKKNCLLFRVLRKSMMLLRRSLIAAALLSLEK